MYKFLLVFLLSGLTSYAQILPEKERAQVIDEILTGRFETLLPELMDRTGIDMWVLISREYNEDPVMRTMLPATWLNARRRTILVFYRDKENNTVERLAVARYNIGDNIVSSWAPESQPDQWKALMEIISERNPNRIGLNYSEHFNIADGLVKTDHEEFNEALPPAFKDKVVSAEELAIG